MADEAKATKSEEQAQADEDFANSKPAHPVLAAAEEKLAAVEAGERVDVERHEAIRAAHGLATAAEKGA